MRVMVTGGAGYIGAVISWELAARGHDVVIYDNLAKGHADSVAGAGELVTLPATAPGRAPMILELRPIADYAESEAGS